MPDEELLHISSFFGTVKDDKIFYESHTDKANKLCGLENGNRYLFLDIFEGKSMMNNIWWERPLLQFGLQSLIKTRESSVATACALISKDAQALGTGNCVESITVIR